MHESTNNDLLVSFLIPAYNAERYISETLNSLLVNPRTDIEIIVTDDGSTDSTGEILSRYNDPRLRIVRTENQGLPEARNTGISHSRGQFLVFLDADDIYEISNLDALLQPLRDSPDIVVSYGRYLKFLDGDRDLKSMPPWIGNLLRQRPSGAVLETLLQRNFIGPPSTMCVRASAARAAGAFNRHLTMGEDWDFSCRLAATGRFQFVDVTTVRYRQHDTSMTRKEGSDLNRLLKCNASIFSNPAIASHFAESKLRRLRRSNIAHMREYAAEQSWRKGMRTASVSLLFSALVIYPRRIPEMLARYVWFAVR